MAIAKLDRYMFPTHCLQRDGQPAQRDGFARATAFLRGAYCITTASGYSDIGAERPPPSAAASSSATPMDPAALPPIDPAAIPGLQAMAAIDDGEFDDFLSKVDEVNAAI